MQRLLFRTIHDVTLMRDHGRWSRATPRRSSTVSGEGASSGKAGGPTRPRRSSAASATSSSTPHHDRHVRQRKRSGDRRRHLQTPTLAQGLKHLFADGAYGRTRLMDAATYRDFVLEIVRRAMPKPASRCCRGAPGCQTHLRTDDAREAPRSQLRAAPRRLRGHDSPRHEWPASLTRLRRASSNGLSLARGSARPHRTRLLHADTVDSMRRYHPLR